MNGYESKYIVEGARTIRGCLVALLGEKADMIDQKLSNLLAQCQDSNVDQIANYIVEVMEQHTETEEWLHVYILSATNAAKVYKNYQPLIGDSESTQGPKYACPKCRNEIWYRFSVGDPIPACEKCKLRFERVVEDYVCPEGDYTWYIFTEETPIPRCPTHRMPLIAKR